MRCRAYVFAAVSLFFVLLAACSQTEPVLEFHGPPIYPNQAIEAHIQGEVRLQFTIDAGGAASGVTILSGSPILAPSALKFVQQWRFEKPPFPVRHRKYETTIVYRLAAFALDKTAGNRRVAVATFRHVEITAGVHGDNCDATPARVPPTVGRNDFVELTRTACLGTCPNYTVRVYANGRVRWDGRSWVQAKGARYATIRPADARALLDRFRTPEFWGLCGSYRIPTMDYATDVIRVSIGGEEKSVSDYAASAPSWVQDLEAAVDAAGGTHRWRHGDPVTEPLINLSFEGLPKPGLTPLMSASRRGDVNRIGALLQQGAGVSVADASGWTPLMYAAVSDSPQAVKLLLAAGADPNQASRAGDTALMAAATHGIFDRALAKAGANVNAQDSAGETALMYLSSLIWPCQADEVAAALQAGADPSLRDRNGRTALAFLHLTREDRSPLTGWATGQCDKESTQDQQYTATEKLLESAVPHWRKN